MHLTGDASGPLDEELLRETVRTAIHMLDNALDLSAYPAAAAEEFCREQRPVALGILGFQDALDRQGIDYASMAAADFADASAELLAHASILASSELARERGVYPGYAESNWNRGCLPLDALRALAEERGQEVDMDLTARQDWSAASEAVRRDGMRHGVTTTIGPADAGGRITGASPTIEPGAGPRPANTRGTYEIAPNWLVECAARRQKWLDMGQALNLYTADGGLDSLSELYVQAWEKGLKTVRQLHLAATPAAAPPGDSFANPELAPIGVK
jgi:ribonucleoside-diphosphate reductase alpha chain